MTNQLGKRPTNDAVSQAQTDQRKIVQSTSAVSLDVAAKAYETWQLQCRGSGHGHDLDWFHAERELQNK